MRKVITMNNISKFITLTSEDRIWQLKKALTENPFFIFFNLIKKDVFRSQRYQTFVLRYSSIGNQYKT